ncbi:hypothetical protein HHI36_016082, partial [Cryptolaemus montrouzieri]
MMNEMEIDQVLSEHNYAKKDSFVTIYHVDQPPEKAVNTYQESKMRFQGELKKGNFIKLLAPSESICCVLDIEDNSEQSLSVSEKSKPASSEDPTCYQHKLKKAALALKSASDAKAISASDNSVPTTSTTPRESINSDNKE